MGERMLTGRVDLMPEELSSLDKILRLSAAAFLICGMRLENLMLESETCLFMAVRGVFRGTDDVVAVVDGGVSNDLLRELLSTLKSVGGEDENLLKTSLP